MPRAVAIRGSGAVEMPVRWVVVGYGGAKWGPLGRSGGQGEVAALFLGTHTPRLDAKGRLALPARFRADLDAGLVITKGQERCLFVFPLPEFARITESLRAAPVTQQSVGYGRVFFASASQETPDAQGRVTIPPALREYAGLTRDCAVIGANSRVEIWDTEAWSAYLAGAEQAFADAAQEVLPGVF
jgi:MraZ protein